MSAEEYDYLFKCVAVGDGGCGKTALVVRFSQGFFQENYKLTIGVEFAVKTIKVTTKDGKSYNVKLQIWDTGGQERFQYVRPLYYRGSMGSIVLFDLSNRESYDHIPKWLEEVRSNAGKIPMLLVGNKSDLVESRMVTRDEAEQLSKDLDMFYVESSAKSGEGVGDVFAILALLMIGEEIPSSMLAGHEATPAASPVNAEAVKPLSPTINSISKPEPSPAPAFAPKPAAMPAPAFAPKPAAMPAPAFAPKPAAMPAPTFAPKPEPSPAPAFAPKPAAMPAPTFAPKPEPSPAPAFAPKPVAVQQPMAIGEQKPSFVGKSIEGEPDWYAPKPMPKPQVVQETPVQPQPSVAPAVQPKPEPAVNPASSPSFDDLFTPSVPKKAVEEPKPAPAASALNSNPFFGSGSNQFTTGPAPLNPNPVSKPAISSSQPQPSQTPFGFGGQAAQPASNPFMPAKAQPAPQPQNAQPAIKEEKKVSRFSSFLSALKGKKDIEPAPTPAASPEPSPQKSWGFMGTMGSSSTETPQKPASSFNFGNPSFQSQSQAPSPTQPTNTPSFLKSSSTSDTIVCTNCGAVLNKRFKFCNKCGNRIQ